MAAQRTSSTLSEGRSLKRPPFFDGTHYNLWKIQMRVFLMAQDLSLWQIVEDGYTPPSKPMSQWTSQDKIDCFLNAKATYAFYCAVNESEMDRICMCSNAKEIWRCLEIAHEGTEELKQAKIDVLVRRFRLFHMKRDESIGEMIRRLDNIVNDLKFLGKVYGEGEIKWKVLNSLTGRWAAFDFDYHKVSYVELVGKLLSFELRQKAIKEKEKAQEVYY